jgi:UDP-3-O-[3-hydroxymyristoyl] glucosamine N-acyltransferase
LKLRDIAERLQCRLEGDGEVDIVGVAGIQQAQPGDLTFVANRRYLPELATTHASAVILGPAKAGDPGAPCAVLHTDDPYSAFARAVSLFATAVRPAAGIDRLSAVADGASIGADVSIGPFVTVGAGAAIGARTIIFPNVVIGRARRSATTA